MRKFTVFIIFITSLTAFKAQGSPVYNPVHCFEAVQNTKGFVVTDIETLKSIKFEEGSEGSVKIPVTNSFGFGGTVKHEVSISSTDLDFFKHMFLRDESRLHVGLFLHNEEGSSAFNIKQTHFLSEPYLQLFTNRIKEAFRIKGLSGEALHRAHAAWLTENIAYPTFHRDLIRDLNTWYPEENEKGKPHYGTLTSDQKIKLADFIRSQKTLSFDLIALADRIEMKDFHSFLSGRMYENLLANNDFDETYSINRYVLHEMTEGEIDTEEAEFFAKMNLYSLRTNTRGEFYEVGHQTYQITLFLSEEAPELSDLRDELRVWLGHNKKSLQQQRKVVDKFTDVAEKHLDMCSDPRISKLAGSRRLWDCSKDSPFAAVEGFATDFELSLYPNPTAGALNIRCFLEEKGALELTVLSQAGAELYRFTEKDFKGAFEHSLNLPGLSPGMYFVKLRHRNQVILRKFVAE